MSVKRPQVFGYDLTGKTWPMQDVNDILADLGRLSYGLYCESDSWNDDPEPRYDTIGRDGETITAIENLSRHCL